LSIAAQVDKIIIELSSLSTNFTALDKKSDRVSKKLDWLINVYKKNGNQPAVIEDARPEFKNLPIKAENHYIEIEEHLTKKPALQQALVRNAMPLIDKQLTLLFSDQTLHLWYAGKEGHSRHWFCTSHRL
jgi:hypothetical protein